MTKRLYDTTGLTPYRALFLHLILIGYPVRYGLFPTGWGKKYLFIPERYVPPPCSIFQADKLCSTTEEEVLRDYGARFLSAYSLAWVVFFTMRTTTATTVAFHRVLLVLSLTSVLTVSWLQAFYHPTPAELEFSTEFFAGVVWFTLLASAVSAWTIATHPYIPVESMKWSIPANAIFCGAVFNIFLAVASFQVILHDKARFYEHQEATPVIQICFTLAAVQTAMQAILLLRIRYFLTMPQLKTVCLYRVIANVALPFFWFPELAPTLHVDQRITIGIRAASTMTYFLGWLWAGKAEGFSSILSSEKED